MGANNTTETAADDLAAGLEPQEEAKGGMAFAEGAAKLGADLDGVATMVLRCGCDCTFTLRMPIKRKAKRMKRFLRALARRMFGDETLKPACHRGVCSFDLTQATHCQFWLVKGALMLSIRNVPA